jgi:hypothetical protein
MTIQQQIDTFIASQSEPKRTDIQELHRIMLRIAPGCRLWFSDGTDTDGKTVSNPTIGYGLQTLTYAKGATKEFFQIGISANATGISVYILGIKDKTFLARSYGGTLGKAKVTGYCIRFKACKDINLTVLEDAIRRGLHGID